MQHVAVHVQAWLTACVLTATGSLSIRMGVKHSWLLVRGNEGVLQCPLVYVADATSEAVASTPVKVTTDRYGFLIPNEGTPGASTSASDSSPAMSKEMTRVKKWQKMLGTSSFVGLSACSIPAFHHVKYVSELCLPMQILCPQKSSEHHCSVTFSLLAWQLK